MPRLNEENPECAAVPDAGLETRGTTVRLTISSMNAAGEGRAFLDGREWDVEGAVSGETVDALLVHAGQRRTHARCVKVVSTSPYLAADPCPALAAPSACGGCPLGRLDYAHQLGEKRGLLLEALEEQGFDADSLPEVPAVHPSPAPGLYRNKASWWADLDAEGGLVFGLRTGGTAHVSPESLQCRQTPAWMAALARETARALTPGVKAGRLPFIKGLVCRDAGELELNLETAPGRGLEGSEANKQRTRLAGLVTGETTPEEHDALTRELASDAAFMETLERLGLSGFVLIENTRGNNLTGGDLKAFHGETMVTATIDGLAFEVAIDTFLQVNTKQTRALYAKALEWADFRPDDVFLDLYCGIGTMTLMGARSVESAHGVEWVESSVERARENARVNGIENASFTAGPVEKVLPGLLARGVRPTVCVADPAFKGLAPDVPATLTRSPIERLVMVSCNPKTFSRDAAALVRLGWRLEAIELFDMFPGALHVETIGRFTRTLP